MKANIGRLPAALGILAILGGPQSAAAESPDACNELRRALRPGDAVTITQWEGVKVRGRLAEVRECSLVLLAADTRVELNADEIKTVRRHSRAATDTPNRVGDAGRGCSSPGCMAVRLTLAGTTTVSRGLQKLFDRPQVVYRAKSREGATSTESRPLISDPGQPTARLSEM